MLIQMLHFQPESLGLMKSFLSWIKVVIASNDIDGRILHEVLGHDVFHIICAPSLSSSRGSTVVQCFALSPVVVPSWAGRFFVVCMFPTGLYVVPIGAAAPTVKRHAVAPAHYPPSPHRMAVIVQI